MTPQPLVSVILCVYSGNNAPEVQRSLLSILGQDYPNLEIVLVLDGPVPEELRRTVEVLRRESPFPFQIVDLPKNSGLGPALNAGIKKAEGSYLARMDADDESLPHRISAQVRFLLSHPEIDAVGCLMEEVFADGKSHVTSLPLTHENCVREFRRRDPFHHPTVVFRRRFFDKAGLYPPELCEDCAMWLAAFKAGCRFANIDEPNYRMFLGKEFFSRRRHVGWIWPVFKYRLHISREMGFGLSGYFWAVLRLLVMFSPTFLLRFAYKIRSVVWEHT